MKERQLIQIAPGIKALEKDPDYGLSGVIPCELVHKVMTLADDPHQNVVVLVGDEYYPLEDVGISTGSDVVEDGTIVLTIQGNN